MGYVVGTSGESIMFTGDGIEYGPAGEVHAVDVLAPHNRHSSVLGYAICGLAVRVWADQPFDPTADGVDQTCASQAHNE